MKHYSLNQISIRISNVDTPQLSPRSQPIHDLALLQHMNPCFQQFRQHIINTSFRQEAQITTSRLDIPRLWFKLGARFMQIDLLIAEAQGMSDYRGVFRGSKGGVLHAEEVCVEGFGGFNVCYGQDDMIQTFYLANRAGRHCVECEIGGTCCVNMTSCYDK